MPIMLTPHPSMTHFAKLGIIKFHSGGKLKDVQHVREIKVSLHNLIIAYTSNYIIDITSLDNSKL